MTLLQGLPRVHRAARSFARAPGLSIALLLTIALGVGSDTAIFGFLQGLEHPLSALKSTDHVVSIFHQDRIGSPGPLSPDEYRALNNTSGIFDWIGEARVGPQEVRLQGHREIATVADVSPGLAQLLLVPPHKAGAVIGPRMAARVFGDSHNAAGSQVQVGTAGISIEGVASGSVEGLYNDQAIDLWTASDVEVPPGGDRNLWVLARLRNGVSLRRAQTALEAVGHLNVSLAPYTGIAPEMARGLARVGMFLNVSAASVFIIDCINVASFLLGRALKRTHETSLRVALGASRDELFRDLFFESFVVCVTGGVLGLALGCATARVLPALLFVEDAERLSFAPHILPILTASLICVAVMTACGMLPIVGTITDRPWMVLQREAGSSSRMVRRLRSCLVVAQIAACCTLVLSTAFLLASLQTSLRTSAGRLLGNPILLTVQTQPRPDGPEIDVAYFSRVEQAVRSTGGLTPLAWVARLPGSRPAWQAFRVQTTSQQTREATLDVEWLTQESLGEIERKPLSGSMLDARDHGYKIAVVDEKAADLLYGARTAGALIRDAAGEPIEIVGVVKRKQANAHPELRPTIFYGMADRAAALPTAREVRFHVPLDGPQSGVELSGNVVSANYFRTLGMTFVAGKGFPDNWFPGQKRIAILNEAAADFYFNGKPLGAGVINENGLRTEIIGVVRSQRLGTFDAHAEPAIYFPLPQDSPLRMTLMLKARNWNSSAAADLQHRVEGVPGRGGAIDVSTFNAQMSRSALAPLRIALLIGGASAAIALMLSILGLVSAQNDTERQLQADRALRLALGAQRGNIVWVVVKTTASLAVIGIAIGTGLSFVLLRILVSGLSDAATPPLGLWLASMLLPAAALLIASVIPARRASVVSPALLMRDK